MNSQATRKDIGVPVDSKPTTRHKRTRPSRSRPAPKPHRLDELYDALAETWGPAVATKRAYETSGVHEARSPTAKEKVTYDRLWDAQSAADMTRHHAYNELRDAVLEAAGVVVPGLDAVMSWGRPTAIVRTSRRIYLVLPGSWSDAEDDPVGSAEVVAIDIEEGGRA